MKTRSELTQLSLKTIENIEELLQRKVAKVKDYAIIFEIEVLIKRVKSLLLMLSEQKS